MIHNEDPFATDPALRDPVRRFRGRLAAPVTIVTSGDGSGRSGLTVSSLLVVEGEPGLIEVVVGPTSDLWADLKRTGRLVVHICRQSHRVVAEVFAGLRPSPGGVFADVAITASDWGPVLDDIKDRMFSTVLTQEETGHSGLVIASIDRVEIAELDDPLVYFRGRYRALN